MPRHHEILRTLQRLTLSHGSLAVGCVFLAVSMWMIWQNEGRVVQAGRDLGEASIAVSATPGMIEPFNEGRLVHINGQARVTQAIQDSDLDLVFDNTLVVSRHVEMFQWIETAERAPKKPGPAFSYRLGWSAVWQDSSKFRQPNGHANPPLKLASQKWTASDAKLGAFVLDEAVLSRLETPTPEKPVSAPTGWTIAGHNYYLSFDATRPSPGDLRVRYFVLKAPSDVSILAQQTPAGFSAYKIPNGDDLFVVQNGTLSAERMFDIHNRLNNETVWALRGACMLTLWFGLFLIFAGPGAGFGARSLTWDTVTSAGITAMAWTLSIGLSTMALAWIFYRPMLFVTLAMAGIGLGYALVHGTKFAHKREPSRAAVAA